MLNKSNDNSTNQMSYEPSSKNLWSAPAWMTVGADVITRDGRVVTITLVDRDCHHSKKSVEGVFRDNGGPGAWMLNGSFWSSGQKDDWDIVGTAPDHSTANSEQFPTKYCPFDWLDEVVPVLADDPADIAFPGGPTGWLLLADDNEESKENQFCRLPLMPGQIVTFGAHRNYGTFEMQLNENGTYSFSETCPTDATHFRHTDADHDAMHDSIEEVIAKGNPDDWLQETPLKPGRHQIDAWYWSDPIPFRFEVEDGKPKFVRCAGVS